MVGVVAREVDRLPAGSCLICHAPENYVSWSSSKNKILFQQISQRQIREESPGHTRGKLIGLWVYYK